MMAKNTGRGSRVGRHNGLFTRAKSRGGNFGIDRPDPNKARTVREMFREDPGLWYDVAQAVLILSVAVAAVVGAVNCCS